MAIPFECSRITSNNRIGKLIRKDPASDQLINEPGGNMISGEVEKVSCNSLRDMVLELTHGESNRALVYGIAEQNGQILTDKIREVLNDDRVISRTRAFFKFPDGAAIMMFDYDPPKDDEPLTPEQWRGKLYESLPGLEQAPHLWLPSSSSCIFEGDQEIVGIRGQRLLVVVAKGSDISNAGKAIENILWSKGYGYFAISKTGSLLNRVTLCDLQVWSPERFDFIGSTQVELPLEQKRGEPVIFNNDAPPWNLQNVIHEGNLPTVSNLVARNQEIARKLVLVKAKSVRDKWIEGRKALGESNSTLNLAASSGILIGDFVITLEDGKKITVNEILDSKETYHEMRCHDPLEPHYRNDPRIAIIYTDSSQIVIFSHAHGAGSKYYLFRSDSDIVDCGFDPLPDFVRIAPWRFPVTDMDDKGVIRPRQDVAKNFDYLLDRYGINIRYNVITKMLEFDAPNFSGDSDNAANASIGLVSRLCKLSKLCAKDAVMDYLATYANRREINPVVDYLAALKWDGIGRFDELASSLITVDFCQDLLISAIKCLLIQACAAADHTEKGRAENSIIEPQFGYVFTLVGSQGIKKTTWFRNILPIELRQFFKTGEHIDPSDKDSQLKALSAWIDELGELDGITRKRDAAELKAFLTRDKDEIRRPYDRMANKYKRRTVFVGSVNDSAFLRDLTGNRRFLPIEIIGIDEVVLAGIDLDQLWAEAWFRYSQGETWWFSDSEMKDWNNHTDRFRHISQEEQILRQIYDFTTDERLPERKAIGEIICKMESICNPGYFTKIRIDNRKVGELLRQLNKTKSYGSKAMVSGSLEDIYNNSGRSYGWLMPPLVNSEDHCIAIDAADSLQAAIQGELISSTLLLPNLKSN
jgi:hypothetical protein